jgi:hypothetical protein
LIIDLAIFYIIGVWAIYMYPIQNIIMSFDII